MGTKSDRDKCPPVFCSWYSFDGSQRESVLEQVGEEAEDAENAADEEEFEEMIAENQLLSERAKRVTDLLSQGAMVQMGLMVAQPGSIVGSKVEFAYVD